MSAVAAGLERRHYAIEIRDSWEYPQGDETEADLIAIWGDFHGTERIFADRHAFKRLLHIDNGYIQRGHFKGYYSVTYNAKQAHRVLWELPCPSGDRWRALGESIHRWRKSGSKILALGLSRKQCGNLGFEYPSVNRELQRALHTATNMPVAMREKRYDQKDEPLRDVLRKGSWHSVAGYHTKGLIEALLEGRPILALHPCAAQSMGNESLEEVLTPCYPDNREEFFIRLAYHQWTLEEIRQSHPWRKDSPLRIIGRIT